MGFVEGEDTGQPPVQRTKAITWTQSDPAQPPLYQQYALPAPGANNARHLPNTSTFVQQTRQANPNQPTQGAKMVQILTSNRDDLMFNHLFNTISITTNYSAADGRVQSDQIDVTWNKDRIQCGRCDKWFVNEKARRTHKRDFPSGCRTHGMCFGSHAQVLHAQRYEHDRCFVGGCLSELRETEGWDDEVIEKHVKKEHGLLRRKL